MNREARKYYSAIKKFTLWSLNNRPWCMDHDIIAHVKMIISWMPEMIKNEDYEGSQAVKDAVIEFVNHFSDEKVGKDTLINIPEYKEMENFSYHISF